MLASSGSTLFLGGTDSSKYTGSIEYHSVDTSAGFWQAKDAKVIVGSKAIVSHFDTIIDSGSTIMFGPRSAVKTFYAAIPGSKLHSSKNGTMMYSYPCDSLPTVGFNWGGKTWEITPDK